jgi:hypothetical protein
LKSEIAAKLHAKGVKAYSLEALAKDEVKDQTVVGSCDGGSKKTSEPARRSSGGRNGQESDIVASRRAATDVILVVFPVKKHGPGIVANSLLATPSGDPV